MRRSKFLARSRFYGHDITNVQPSNSVFPKTVDSVIAVLERRCCIFLIRYLESSKQKLFKI